jgi:hypothetical protein
MAAAVSPADAFFADCCADARTTHELARREQGRRDALIPSGLPGLPATDREAATMVAVVAAMDVV